LVRANGLQSRLLTPQQPEQRFTVAQDGKINPLPYGGAGRFTSVGRNLQPQSEKSCTNGKKINN